MDTEVPKSGGGWSPSPKETGESPKLSEQEEKFVNEVVSAYFSTHQTQQKNDKRSKLVIENDSMREKLENADRLRAAIENQPTRIRHAVLLKFDEKPEEICRFCDLFLESTDVLENLLRKAAKRSPYDVITHYSKYDKLPNAYEILTMAVTHDQDSAELFFFRLWHFQRLLEPQQIEGLIVKTRHISGRTRLAALVTQGPEPSPDSLLVDPALADLHKIQPQWIDTEGVLRPPKRLSDAVVETMFAQVQIMIARNLWFQRLPVSEETVRKECRRLKDLRIQYSKMPIFAGRNILFVANGEPSPTAKILYEEEYRFGKMKVSGFIMNEQMKLPSKEKPLFAFFRPDAKETSEESEKLKESVLQSIINTPPPFTMIFDGHGSKKPQKGLILTIDGKVTISALELAKAFNQRMNNPAFQEWYKANPEKRDVLFLFCCYSSNFLRNFYDHLRFPHKPVVIGANEYGHPGYTRDINPAGNEFFKKLIKQKTEKGITVDTFFDLEYEFAQEPKEHGTNPVIYVPDDTETGPMQISERGNGSNGTRPV